MNYCARQICITEVLISVNGYDSRLKKKVAHAGYPSPGPRPCCTQFYALSEANMVSYLTDFYCNFLFCYSSFFLLYHFYNFQLSFVLYFTFFW